MIAPTTEIATIPCAGIRIAQGQLAGLMAWRFVVELHPLPKYSHALRLVMTNFILDTGITYSRAPIETLKALGYVGDIKGKYMSASISLSWVLLNTFNSRNTNDVEYTRSASEMCHWEIR